MKIATWNVNSLTARWPRVEEWITEHEPDVLLIQETKQTDAKFPFQGFADLGYEAAHYGQGQWNGVAIISKVGLDNVERGLGDDEQARLIGATCGGVRVYSAYIPNGRALDDPHYQYKLGWLGDLRALIASVPPTQALLVGGDFNVTPSDLDCWDPSALAGQTHVSEPERQALRDLESAGVIDLTRDLHPHDANFSWWDYRQGAFRRDMGLRIDLLYVNSILRERALDSFVDRAARAKEKPSDHAPVVGIFE